MSLLADESSNKDESEEAKASTREQFEMDWACTWKEVGGVSALAENEAQGY